MLYQLWSVAKLMPVNLERRAVVGTACCTVLALAWLLTFQGAAARGAETPSALESDPKGWEDVLPPADLKGWYRTAVPPTDKLGRQQWHVDADKMLLICDGDGGHDMLLSEKEYGDVIFHIEFRYVRVEGKSGYNSGVYVRNSKNGAIWHQAQIGDASGGYLFGETANAEKKPTFFTFANDVQDGRVKPVGEWNTLEMTARGKTVTLWVNGAVTSEFRDCGMEKGHIGVEGEGFLIEFRNMKVKELK